MRDFTVFYIVGQPRTGSTFVGDSLARAKGIVNAGEVWQTLRTVGLVTQPGFDGSDAPWARPEAREEKSAQICRDRFWAQVVEASHDREPYAAVVSEASRLWPAMVDCSKTDRGIERYLDLDCRVVVVHSIRAFSSWAESMQKHAKRQGLPQRRRARLLMSYLLWNRKLRRRWQTFDYLAIAQENLANADALLAELPEIREGMNGYLNAEMFGTPGYSGSFDAARATQQVSLADRILYRMIGAGRVPGKAD